MTPLKQPAQALAPLQHEGFGCTISVSRMPDQIKAGTGPVNFRVELVNTSSAPWPKHRAAGPIDFSVNVSYHWIIPKSGEVISEGLRAFLPSDLAPGERVEVDLPVMPPAESGSYLLRIEPVQEKVAWFSSQGGCKREIEIGVVS